MEYEFLTYECSLAVFNIRCFVGKQILQQVLNTFLLLSFCSLVDEQDVLPFSSLEQPYSIGFSRYTWLVEIC